MTTTQEILLQVNKIVSPVYLVGGSVRDEIMGKEICDYDFATPLAPEVVEQKIRAVGKRPILVGKRFGTIMMRIEGFNIEITSFRSENYEEGNRKPVVDFVKDISEDLKRRDFTINSLAKRDNKVIDLFGGREDIENKIIKAVGNPTIRFKEDPLRLLRAARFASQLGFDIEPVTLKSMKKNAHHILDVSKERWTQEMDKLLMGKYVSKGLNYMWETDLFMYMIPELHLQYKYNQNSPYHHLLLHEHTNIVVENVEGLINRWAALLHDIAKPFVRTDKLLGELKLDISDMKIKSNYLKHDLLGCEMVKRLGRNMKWSNERTNEVSQLVLHHLEETNPLRKADYIGKRIEDENKTIT
jgi:tRNA nucleotidyltransferase (CCA-adding enzyme)